VNVEVKNPFSGITLVFPEEKIKEACIFLYQRSGQEDLDTALEVCWSLTSLLTQEEKGYVSLIQTIVNATLDGLIKPEDFDIYSFWTKILSEVV
jgi:hypothetical protein